LNLQLTGDCLASNQVEPEGYVLEPGLGMDAHEAGNKLAVEHVGRQGVVVNVAVEDLLMPIHVM